MSSSNIFIIFLFWSLSCSAKAYDPHAEKYCAKIPAWMKTSEPSLNINVDHKTVREIKPTNDEKLVGKGMNAEFPIPWQASVRRKIAYGILEYSNFKKSWCGGTILNKNTVLTAAHCLDDSYDEYAIVAGAYYNDDSDDKKVRNPQCNKMASHLSALFCNHRVQFRHARPILHPDYDKPPVSNDVAILKLIEDLSFNQNVFPACIGIGVYPVDGSVIASGWGANEPGGQTDVLQYLPMEYEPNNEKCKESRIVQDAPHLAKYITPEKFCAYNYESWKNSNVCAGDSGGPVVVNFYGYAFVYGIVHIKQDKSFCSHKPDFEHGTVFTRVDSHLDWIAKYLYI